MSEFGTRIELNGLPFIDIVDLKKRGFFESSREGSLSWSHPMSGSAGSISIAVNSSNETVHLRYRVTKQGSDEVVNMDYYITLTTTPCNFGGKRWWFMCPLVIGGRPCHGRVRRLYKGSNYFACRNCQNLCYSDQNENHQGSYVGINQAISLERRAIKLENEITVPYYKGRPTRKMRQYLKLTRALKASTAVEDFIANIPEDEV